MNHKHCNTKLLPIHGAPNYMYMWRKTLAILRHNQNNNKCANQRKWILANQKIYQKWISLILMIIELWEKRISLLESMAFQIIGMFQYHADKERFFDCPLLLKSVPWLHEYLKFRTFQLKQSSSWTNKTDNEKQYCIQGYFCPA